MFQRGPSSNALLRDKGEKQAKKFAAKLKKLSKMPDCILLRFFAGNRQTRGGGAPQTAFIQSRERSAVAGSFLSVTKKRSRQRTATRLREAERSAQKFKHLLNCGPAMDIKAGTIRP